MTGGDGKEGGGLIMRTVVGNNAGLNQGLHAETTAHAYPDAHCQKAVPRSCFYDFGIKRRVEFTGYIKEQEDPFIESIPEMFHMQQPLEAIITQGG